MDVGSIGLDTAVVAMDTSTGLIVLGKDDRAEDVGGLLVFSIGRVADLPERTVIEEELMYEAIV